MKLADYLGAPVRDLLAIPPFSKWKVTRSVEEDLPNKEVWYEFEGHGVDVICYEDELIRTIFVRRGDGEALADVAFSLSRREVLARLGPPSKSGPATRSPALGDSGPWDLFTIPEGSLHIHYRFDRDEIEMVTWMRRGTEP